jgi:arginine exporter protein ArgO
MDFIVSILIFIAVFVIPAIYSLVAIRKNWYEGSNSKLKLLSEKATAKESKTRDEIFEFIEKKFKRYKKFLNIFKFTSYTLVAIDITVLILIYNNTEQLSKDIVFQISYFSISVLYFYLLAKESESIIRKMETDLINWKSEQQTNSLIKEHIELTHKNVELIRNLAEKVFDEIDKVKGKTKN